MIDSLVLLAGLLHFALLPVSFSVPLVLDWKRELAPLSAFNRRIVWVHGAFIVLVIVGFGALTLVERASMSPGLAAFIGLFWLARLGVQLFYYKPSEWPPGPLSVAGRLATSALFAFWSALYLSLAASAALRAP